MIIDRFELFGTNVNTGVRHNLGCVQLDRAELDDPDSRIGGINRLTRFAVGSQFTDGSRPVNVEFVLAFTNDVDAGVLTYHRYAESAVAE